jgi:RNA polymerase sigma factor (sigma-70 family)
MNKHILNFCNTLCSSFGQITTTNCINYIENRVTTKTKASYLENIFDFCDSNTTLDRVWAMFRYAQTEIEQKCKICFEYDDCKDYVTQNILKNNLSILKKFDKSKGARETTYINVVIRSRITDFLRKVKKESYKKGKYQEEIRISSNSNEEMTSQMETLEKREILDLMISDLRETNKINNEELLILKLLYQDEYEPKEVAQILSKSTKYIYKKNDSIIKKLKRQLPKYYQG